MQTDTPHFGVRTITPRARPTLYDSQLIFLLIFWHNIKNK